jgi:hypothetical protein
VAGLLAGTLLTVAVVATAMPEIVREVGVSVEEARVLYKAVLFGAAVGVGFGRGFSRRFFGGFLSLAPRPLLLVTPSRRRLPRPRLLPSRDVALVTAAALAASPVFQKLKERWEKAK